MNRLPCPVWQQLAIAETHPLRVQLLELIAASPEPLSPKMLAEETGEKLGNVSFHVSELAKKGLIELRRTEPARGALSHYYGLAEASS
jgi:predicted transcriptional regulator